MSLSFDLFWSFRSPYCYLAGPRLRAITRDYDVTCRVHPVYPHALRMPELLAARPDGWLDHFKTDIARTAAFLGMPIAWPRPDPVITAQGVPVADQPHTQRLTRLGVAADQVGAGLDFLCEIGALMWSPQTSDWTAPGLLDAAVRRAGLSLVELDAAIAGAPERFDAIIESNQTAQRAAGHWGVPLMVFQGEAFFGQDRIDQLVWRMRASGLSERR